MELIACHAQWGPNSYDLMRCTDKQCQWEFAIPCNGSWKQLGRKKPIEADPQRS